MVYPARAETAFLPATLQVVGPRAEVSGCEKHGSDDFPMTKDTWNASRRRWSKEIEQDCNDACLMGTTIKTHHDAFRRLSFIKKPISIM